MFVARCGRFLRDGTRVDRPLGWSMTRSHRLIRSLVVAGASLTTASVGCGGKASGLPDAGGAVTSSGSNAASWPGLSTSVTTTSQSTASTQTQVTLTGIDVGPGVDAGAASDAAQDAADATDAWYAVIYPPIR
jgi:hypothetical protein